MMIIVMSWYNNYKWEWDVIMIMSMINYVMCNEDKFKVTYKGVGIYLVCIYISIMI